MGLISICTYVHISRYYRDPSPPPPSAGAGSNSSSRDRDRDRGNIKETSLFAELIKKKRQQQQQNVVDGGRRAAQRGDINQTTPAASALPADTGKSRLVNVSYQLML